MAEPKVRFTHDNGSKYPIWEKKRLRDVCSLVGVRGCGAGYIGTENMLPDFAGVDYSSERVGSGTVFEIGDVLMSNIRPYLKKTWQADKSGVCSTDVLVFHADNVKEKYLYQIISNDSFIKYVMSAAKGSKMPRGDKDHMLDMELFVPSLEEQQKIADFLSSVDEVITASEQEVANLETQKKAVMKKIFSQEVRFKRTDGSDFPEWEEKALGSFAKRVTRKNKDNACKLPLTISAEYGLIDQSEFFNKTVASKDMSTYYLLQNGEFAFNKSTSKDYPVGAIKRLDRYAAGAVSPLYICFELYGDTVLSDFAVQYFETDCWHQGVLDIAQEGARTHGLLNISVPGFFETVHELPSDPKEQRLIANFLSDFDEAIAAAKKELELWKELKKGLLQQMFV